MSYQLTAPLDFFSLDAVDGKITLSADPELAQDLIYGLSILLDLSRAIRAKITHARAYAAATDQKDLDRRRIEFERRSSEIFSKFQVHLNNGCCGDKAKALQCIKQDFSIGYGDARVYVTEGRRLSRLTQRSATSGKHPAPRGAKVQSKTARRKEVPA
jgi:hypothetical protein